MQGGPNLNYSGDTGWVDIYITDYIYLKSLPFSDGFPVSTMTFFSPLTKVLEPVARCFPGP